MTCTDSKRTFYARSRWFARTPLLQLRKLNSAAWRVYVAIMALILAIAAYAIWSLSRITVVHDTYNLVGAFIACFIFFVCIDIILGFIANVAFFYLVGGLTDGVSLIYPVSLTLEDDKLLMQFNVKELVVRKRLPRMGYEITYNDDILYSIYIEKKDIENLVMDGNICKIEGNCLIYMPRLLYTSQAHEYNNFDYEFHALMNDLFLTQDDKKNRNPENPWIVKRSDFTFIFRFEDDAKKALLNWAR